MRGKTALTAVLCAAAAIAGAPRPAAAHCDTLDGPVVVDARTALERGEVSPVLRWVRASDEPEIRAAFDRTLAVRALGPGARELADRSFLETLVRVHRAGEGAPYTGLEPAGSPVDPAVRLADQAIAAGSPAHLEEAITGHFHAALEQRWQELAEAKARADESVAAGRRYVAAYVDFVHYAEKVHAAIAAEGHSHDEGHAE